jgi:hypothetical protein
MVLERLLGKSAHLGEILLILTAKETQRISAFDWDQQFVAVRNRVKMRPVQEYR